MAGMLDRLRRLHPFKTAESQRLALLFGIVYFAQGMYDLPTQTLTLVLKERFGLGAGQAATFFLIATIPWYVKPIYGLISDFVPLLGRRRQSYLLVSSALAAVSGAILASLGDHTYTALLVFVTLMGLGLAYTDVMVDALMVENGRSLGLTGAFQSVQWAAIYGASIIVGLLGGQLAGQRNLHLAFTIAAGFPVVSFLMTLFFIREPRAPADRLAFQRTLAAIRHAYQTDVLKFSQEFIGLLQALSAVGFVVGALIYAPLSRRVPLKQLIVASIGSGTVATLGYLLYQSATSALIIDPLFGVVGMITQLAFLDLAAKACPPRVEASFFALQMSVYNLGVKGSQITGGYLYDALGFTPLVLISASVTALAWLLVPLVKIDRIEAKARTQAQSAQAVSAT